MYKRFFLFIGFVFLTSNFCYSQEKNIQDTLVVIDTLVVYDTVTIPKRTIIEETKVEEKDNVAVNSNTSIDEIEENALKYFNEISILSADYQLIGLQSNISYKSYYLLITAGMNFNLSEPLIGGVGFGKKIDVSSKIYLSPEILSMWYFPFSRDYPPQNNNHLRIGVAYQLSPKFSVKIAPSIYCGWRTNVANNKEYNEIIHIISPSRPFYAKETGSNSTFDIGIGLSLELVYHIK